MGKKQNDLTIKRFESTTGKNQYLLLSEGEAAVIDVNEASDEIGEILDRSGIGLKFLIPPETTLYTGSGELTRMGNEGWIQCLRSA